MSFFGNPFSPTPLSQFESLEQMQRRMYGPHPNAHPGYYGASGIPSLRDAEIVNLRNEMNQLRFDLHHTRLQNESLGGRIQCLNKLNEKVIAERDLLDRNDNMKRLLIEQLLKDKVTDADKIKSLQDIIHKNSLGWSL